jgi:hypothetical protein
VRIKWVRGGYPVAPEICGNNANYIVWVSTLDQTVWIYGSKRISENHIVWLLSNFNHAKAETESKWSQDIQVYH